MSNQPLTRNITRIFREATDMDRATGHGWYERARILAVKLAQENSDLPASPVTFDGRQMRKQEIRRAAGVIAALSPRLAWRKNVEYAQMSYMVYNDILKWRDNPISGQVAESHFAGMIPTLNTNARKAFRILNGEDPADVLGGPKVTAFYWTIVRPWSSESVVIDRHAIDIAYGKVMTDATRPTLKGKTYAEVADLYRRAAKIISRELDEIWTPAQVQATTWTYWRRERAAAYHGEGPTQSVTPSPYPEPINTASIIAATIYGA